MLIGLLGRMGSGKGTVADELVEVYGFRQDSYAATLKDITALLFNWDRAMLVGDTIESRSEREQIDEWWSEKLGIENFTPRLALQLIGTDVFRNNFHKDIWMLSVMARYNVDRGEEPFWWEIAKKAAAGDEDAIAEMAKPHINVHASEWAWANEVPDEVIRNDGTLQQLYGMVRLLNNRYRFDS